MVGKFEKAMASMVNFTSAGGSGLSTEFLTGGTSAPTAASSSSLPPMLGNHQVTLPPANVPSSLPPMLGNHQVTLPPPAGPSSPPPPMLGNHQVTLVPTTPPSPPPMLGNHKVTLPPVGDVASPGATPFSLGNSAVAAPPPPQQQQFSYPAVPPSPAPQDQLPQQQHEVFLPGPPATGLTNENLWLWSQQQRANAVEVFPFAPHLAYCGFACPPPPPPTFPRKPGDQYGWAVMLTCMAHPAALYDYKFKLDLLEMCVVKGYMTERMAFFIYYGYDPIYEWQ